MRAFLSLALLACSHAPPPLPPPRDPGPALAAWRATCAAPNDDGVCVRTTETRNRGDFCGPDPVWITTVVPRGDGAPAALARLRAFAPHPDAVRALGDAAYETYLAIPLPAAGEPSATKVAAFQRADEAYTEIDDRWRRGRLYQHAADEYLLAPIPYELRDPVNERNRAGYCDALTARGKALEARALEDFRACAAAGDERCARELMFYPEEER